MTASAAASSSRQITVTYALHPPTSVDPSTVTHNNSPVPTSHTSTYPINTSESSTTSSETSNCYNALAPTLRTAQKELMESLSAWKESIGDSEKMKEDPGTPGFGRGKAAIMSEGVMDPEEDSEDEDGEVGEGDA